MADQEIYKQMGVVLADIIPEGAIGIKVIADQISSEGIRYEFYFENSNGEFVQNSGNQEIHVC